MAQDDWNDLLQAVRQAAQVAGTVYKDITGEDLDVESTLRHYPLVALGLAAGAGAVAGWWIGRRSAPALPRPPAAERPLPDTAADQPSATEGLAHGLEALEELLPGAVERVRESLPEITVPDEVKLLARGFLEQELSGRIEALAENVDQRLSSWLGSALGRLDGGEEVHLDDPEEPNGEER